MPDKRHYLKYRISSLERSISGRLGRIRHLHRLGQWWEFERTVLRQLKTGKELQAMKALRKC
jgi:hypothetical protein